MYTAKGHAGEPSNKEPYIDVSIRPLWLRLKQAKLSCATFKQTTTCKWLIMSGQCVSALSCVHILSFTTFCWCIWLGCLDCSIAQLPHCPFGKTNLLKLGSIVLRYSYRFLHPTVLATEMFTVVYHPVGVKTAC